jgi:hypothetical protein
MGKEKNQLIVDKYLKTKKIAWKCKKEFYRFVRRSFKTGKSEKELAYICGLSRQRISEIIHHFRK